MAGNQSILDLTVIPNPVGGNCYIVKDNTDYRVSAGGAGGLATLGSDGKLLASQTPAVTITVTWASISGKPTTVAGYGITDAVTTSSVQTIGGTKTFTSTIAGSISGNAATASAVSFAGITGKPTTTAGYGITDAVTTSGAQTISSTKTFSSTIVGSINGSAGSVPWTGITGKPTTVEGFGITNAVTDTEFTWTNLAGKPTTFAPAAHSAALLTSGTVPSARLDGSYTDLVGVLGTGGATFSIFRSSGAGSAGVPAYSWSSDTNTGIYNSAADQITISTGGVARATVNSAGLTVAGAISATGNITGYSSDKRLKTNIRNITFPMDKLFRIGGYTFSWDLEKCNEVGFLPANAVEHGVIAQEVQKIVPDAVSAAAFDPEYLTVNYARLVPLLIECIKELNNRLDRLEAQTE